MHRSPAVIEFSLDGCLLGTNDNFLRLMGYRLEDIRDQQHRMFVAPSERQSLDDQTFWSAL